MAGVWRVDQIDDGRTSPALSWGYGDLMNAWLGFACLCVADLSVGGFSGRAWLSGCGSEEEMSGGLEFAVGWTSREQCISSSSWL